LGIFWVVIVLVDFSGCFAVLEFVSLGFVGVDAGGRRMLLEAARRSAGVAGEAATGGRLVLAALGPGDIKGLLGGFDDACARAAEGVLVRGGPFGER